MNEKICPNCGARQRRADARFCQNCGYPLHSDPSPTTSTMPSTTASKPSWLWLIGAILFLLLLGSTAIIAFGPGRDMLTGLLHSPTPSRPTFPPAKQPPSTPSSSPASSQPTAANATKTPPPIASSTVSPPTTTPIPTTPPPPTPIPTKPTKPTGPAEEQIRALMNIYRDVKIESLTHWDTRRLDDVLTDPVLERQKRGICGLRNAGQYYQYNNREFHTLSISFPDPTHATVLARIRENRVLKDRRGSVIKDYGHEDYRAVFLLERNVNNQWKIYCFQALDDDEPISCHVKIPKKNPCNQ